MGTPLQDPEDGELGLQEQPSDYPEFDAYGLEETMLDTPVTCQ